MMNWEAYARDAVALLDTVKAGDDDHIMLNNTAWEFYEQIGDERLLERAVSWVRRSIELKDADYSNDTHAMLLYKLGRLDEAIKAEEKALEMAKEADNKFYVKSFTEAIEKMKRGEPVSSD